VPRPDGGGFGTAYMDAVPLFQTFSVTSGQEFVSPPFGMLILRVHGDEYFILGMTKKPEFVT